MNLQELIFDASTQLGSEACRAGKHQWESEGGRACPRFDYVDWCSQAVYRCRVCGVYDYGAQGGPGHRDCFTRLNQGCGALFAAI